MPVARKACPVGNSTVMRLAIVLLVGACQGGERSKRETGADESVALLPTSAVGQQGGGQIPSTAATERRRSWSIALALPGPRASFEEVLVRMRAVATQENRKAQPLHVTVKSFSPDGTVDLTRDGEVSATFVYRYADPTGRPGEDLIAGAFQVGVTTRRCDGNARFCLHVSTFNHDFPHERTLGTPTCTLAKAWEAAIRSGIPANAVASAVYAVPRKMPLIRIAVEGHAELTRWVDAASCRAEESLVGFE